LRFIFSPFAAAIIGQTPESGTDVSSKAARLPSPVPPGLGLGGRNPIEKATDTTPKTKNRPQVCYLDRLHRACC